VEYACCCRATCDRNSWINSCVFGKESPTFEHFLQIFNFEVTKKCLARFLPYFEKISYRTSLT